MFRKFSKKTRRTFSKPPWTLSLGACASLDGFLPPVLSFLGPCSDLFMPSDKGPPCQPQSFRFPALLLRCLLVVVALVSRGNVCAILHCPELCTSWCLSWTFCILAASLRCKRLGGLRMLPRKRCSSVFVWLWLCVDRSPRTFPLFLDAPVLNWLPASCTLSTLCLAVLNLQMPTQMCPFRSFPMIPVFCQRIGILSWFRTVIWTLIVSSLWGRANGPWRSTWGTTCGFLSKNQRFWIMVCRFLVPPYLLFVLSHLRNAWSLQSCGTLVASYLCMDRLPSLDIFAVFFKFTRVLTSTARLETGGCQMPLSFMLMVPADFCRQDLCFVNCMCHGKLIGFLVQWRTDVIFITKHRFQKKGPKQTCSPFHTPLKGFMVLQLMVSCLKEILRQKAEEGSHYMWRPVWTSRALQRSLGAWGFSCVQILVSGGPFGGWVCFG